MTPASPAEVQEQLRVRRGRGSPLPDGVRQHMELRFDADFSGVRIHTDDPAIQLTRLLKANAFTQGNEIFFNQGRFAPGSREGQHLLAHELTHTIQQGAAGARQIQPQAEPSAVQRQEDDEATILIRPELLAAIKLARGEIGKVNAKQTNTDNTRLGWERLVEYFFTAFGEKEVVHPDVIKFIQQTKDSKGSKKDAMPSWCGIFVWWSYKKAGIPIPNWKLGVSIMGWVTPRKSGELPRKGDIAYRDQPFQHFAMVTGVESPESAAGKDFKSILVATINGNTSGNDNIGGQVEEKWEPISRWSGFFDPVAMLDMPPAPLVKTGVEPESSAATGAGEEAAAAAEEATVETPPTDVCHLEEAITSEPEVPGAGEADVAVEQPEPPPAVEAEVEVELPPAPALPAAEEVAKVEPLPLEGSSDEAMAGFTEASPSQMATTQPGLGEELDGKINQEKQDEVDNAPVLVAQTSGTVAEGLTPPDQIPVPGETPIGDGVTGAEPGDLTAKPHENFGAAPSNEANEKELDKQEEGGFLSWLRDNIKGFLGQIRTKDPGLDTKAGERPKMQLEGEADPGRMAQQREEAKTQIVGQRDATTTRFKNHPGQQNIQPKQINEEKTGRAVARSRQSASTTQPDDRAWPTTPAPALRPTCAHKADELLKPDARRPTWREAKTADAHRPRRARRRQGHRDRQRRASDAPRSTRTPSKDQRDIVVENRGEVAQQQEEGIERSLRPGQRVHHRRPIPSRPPRARRSATRSRIPRARRAGAGRGRKDAPKGRKRRERGRRQEKGAGEGSGERQLVGPRRWLHQESRQGAHRSHRHHLHRAARGGQDHHREGQECSHRADQCGTRLGGGQAQQIPRLGQRAGQHLSEGPLPGTGRAHQQRHRRRGGYRYQRRQRRGQCRHRRGRGPGQRLGRGPG